MGIYQYSGGVLVNDLLSVGHRVAVGLHYLSLVGTGCQQQLFPFFGCSVHVGLVFRER